MVLVDGRMAGVWEHGKQRSRLTVNVNLFAPPSEEVMHGIEGETARLGSFLNADVQLAVSSG